MLKRSHRCNHFYIHTISSLLGCLKASVLNITFKTRRAYLRLINQNTDLANTKHIWKVLLPGTLHHMHNSICLSWREDTSRYLYTYIGAKKLRFWERIGCNNVIKSRLVEG